MSKPKKLFLLDAFALIFRGYYAFIKNPRINSKGMDTSAIFGFMNSLLDVIKREKPDYLAVCFDKGGSVSRKELFEDYKANRNETPEAIKIAVPYIQQILEAMQIPVIEKAGFEADDIIGTLAKQAEKEGFQTFMVTPDKDFAQLVSENIFMYRPARMGNAIEIWGIPEVQARFEIERPEQVIDYLGMMGDAVDNIPGLPGVGDKTAKKFLKEYGSMEVLLENTHELKGKMKERIEANKELGMLSKELAKIILDVPVTFEADSYKLTDPNIQEVQPLFDELEFRRMQETIQRIFNTSEVVAAPKEKNVVNSPTPTANKGQMDLFTPAGAGTISPTEDTIQSKQTLVNTPHAYQCIDSPLAFSLLMEKLLKQKSVCFDTETTSINALQAELVGIAFSWGNHKGYYLPFPDDQKDAQKIIEQIRPFFEQEGIEGVYIVDSAGGMMPNDVKKYVLAISNKIRTKNFRVGFHGHNNLGLANANCISAIEAGATLDDSSLMGMGRSSGNAITEMLVPILQREGKIRKNINVSILFNLIKKVINPIYKKSSFDENEILIGKSYFHSSNFDELKNLAVKLNVKTSKILQNISFKKNSNLDEKLKKKIRLKFKKFKKEKKTNLQNIYNNIEYVNVNSIKNINNLKKILISEKFKKKSEMAITICRGNTNHLKIKNIYSTDNIILGHLESPNKILDKLIIRNFSDYFIFLDEKIKLEKDNRFKKLNIFSYSEEKIFIDAIFDFINALNYSRILTNVKKFKYLENNYKGNKKNKNLVIFEDNLKKSDIFLKKIKTEFDILLVNILKRDVSEIKRKNSYLARIFKPNYGLTLCHDILRKVDSIKNLQTTFDIEYMDKNTKIAAGGQIAEKNSIIVNNIKNPTKIIGISDGKGGLLDVDFENQKKKKINNWFINKIIN